MSEFADAQKQSFDTPVQTSMVIVGAGAAGITYGPLLGQCQARRCCCWNLAGWSLESATQSLFQRRVKGINYYDMAACRLRYFGGTTNH